MAFSPKNISRPFDHSQKSHTNFRWKTPNFGPYPTHVRKTAVSWIFVKMQIWCDETEKRGQNLCKKHILRVFLNVFLNYSSGTTVRQFWRNICFHTLKQQTTWKKRTQRSKSVNTRRNHSKHSKRALKTKVLLQNDTCKTQGNIAKFTFPR